LSIAGKVGSTTYLGEDHGRDLLGGESVLAAKVVNLDLGVSVVINNGEGPRLHVLLGDGVIITATDQTPGRGLLVGAIKLSG